MEFEVDFEANVIQLYNELKERTWSPGKSICFIVTKPVKREVFAAPFRDRIVHHILINRINPYLEKYFIKDTYACRVNKGTHAAIRRVEHFMRTESENCSKNAYVLKLDIKGFFMSIDKRILFSRLDDFLLNNYPDYQKNCFEQYLCKKIIFDDPSKNCLVISSVSVWNDLPTDKSLFHSRTLCGLPIGNLTSQVFANFYLSDLDHFIKHELGVRCYVRYVDDMVLLSKDRDFLIYCKKRIERHLSQSLALKLHPKKVYLQKIEKGVAFLGTFIKPFYTDITRRTKNNFISKLKKYASSAENHKPANSEMKDLRQSLNSYLGIIGHYKTWKFRKKQISYYFKDYLCRHFSIKQDVKKIVIKG